MSTRVLLVEDDPEIAGLLTDYLTPFHIEIAHYTHPEDALASMAMEHYDLAILDLMLPQMDGMELCKRLRAVSNLPVVISSARGELEDKVAALEVGADDYLEKPYHPRELVARIQSVLRRYKGMQSQECKTLQVDEQRMVISLEGQPLELTTAEYEVLKLLMEKPGYVLSREFIANNVESMRWESTDKSIDVVISRIRKKLGDNPKNPRFIKSIKGAGYKFIG